MATTDTENKTPAKPFLKWAGGKGQLLDEIDKRLPKDEIRSGQINTYVEHFTGVGLEFLLPQTQFDKPLFLINNSL